MRLLELLESCTGSGGSQIHIINYHDHIRIIMLKSYREIVEGLVKE